MKKIINSIIEGIYEGIQKSEELRDQISREEIEHLVISGYRSFVNKTSVLIGAVFIYFFFKLKGTDLSSLFVIFITFWMAWVILGNHVSQLQKLLEERKKENK